MLYYLLLLLAGALQGVMVSLNGQLGNYYSPFAICFFVHGIALILLLAYLLAKKTPLGFKGAPWYVYLVGALGIAIVASTSCGADHLLAAHRPVRLFWHAGTEIQCEADSGLCAVGRRRGARGDGLRRGAGCFFTI